LSFLTRIGQKIDKICQDLKGIQKLTKNLTIIDQILKSKIHIGKNCKSRFEKNLTNRQKLFGNLLLISEFLSNFEISLHHEYSNPEEDWFEARKPKFICINEKQFIRPIKHSKGFNLEFCSGRRCKGIGNVEIRTSDL
jgi:hypothetical protein